MYDPYALKIYTDGCAYKNPGGPGGIAAIAEFPDALNREYEVIFKKGFKDTTNNRMELNACIEALKYIRENAKVFGVGRSVIITDSQYVYDNQNRAQYWKDDGWRNKEGRPVDNSDLWGDFLSARQKAGMRVDIKWLKGKTTETVKLVDKLAKEAGKDIIKQDERYKVGKVARSKVQSRKASTLFVARSQNEIIRIYRKRLIRDGEYKIFFDLFSKEDQVYTTKCCAYTTEDNALKLHRAHIYDVVFNNSLTYPIIEMAVDEITSEEDIK